MQTLKNFRPTTLVTVAAFFLAIGTFTSVSLQGLYQVLMLFPLLYFTKRAWGRQFRLPVSSWLWLAFGVWAAVTVFVNWAIIPKPTANLGKVKYYFLAALGIFPLGAWLKVVSDRTLSRLFRWFVVSMVVAGAYVLISRGFIDRNMRPLTETMRYGYGTALVLVLMLGLVLSKRERAWVGERWAWVGMAFGLAGIVMLNSRGAQAAFLLGAWATLWFWKRKLALAATLVLGLAGGFVTWNYFYGSSERSSVRILANKNNNSDVMRRSQWQAAWKAFGERPVMGWGMGNFHSQVDRIKQQYDLDKKDYNDAHAHNVLLEIAAGTGLIGVLLFVSAFLVWMWEVWVEGGAHRAFLLPLFLAIIFEAQFEVILDANNATMFSFLYALSFSTQKRYQLMV